MTDTIDIFLGDLKCKLQLFRPEPGEVFILTIPREISFEEENRLKSEFEKLFPENKNRIAIITGGVMVGLVTEDN